jgi:hypothetical protein
MGAGGSIDRWGLVAQGAVGALLWGLGRKLL